jgi:hypothetical protein
MAITMVEARKRTSYPLAQQILQSSSETDDFYQFIAWESVYGAADVHTFLRRKGKVPGRWRFPGETIAQVDNPLVTRVTSQLREMVNKTNTRDYVERNMSNTWDQRMLNRIELVKDMARDVARSAIAGRYMDTCVIRSGGGINAAALLAAGTSISPGPFYVEGMGDGVLNFDQPTTKLSFKAPGDANPGEGVVLSGPFPQIVTLKSDNDAYFITLTVQAAPGASGHAELQFSSSSKQPDGLIALCDSSMVIPPDDPVNGDAMSFDILDALQEQMDKLFVKEECAYVMHTRQYRALKARGRGLGGARIEDKMFGDKAIPTYEGIPILRNKYIPDVSLGPKAPRSHSAFLVNMNPEKGFFGIAAGGPEGTGMQSPDMRDGTPVMGFKIRDLGMARDSNADEEMIVWNGTFSNKSVQAIARRDGIFDK